MSRRMHDVVIAGAGPTGLTLGVALRQCGVETLVIDRSAAGVEDSRAAIVHVRSMELFDALGVSESLVAVAAPIAAAAYYDLGVEVSRLSFDRLGSRHLHALGVAQREVERVLSERYQELGGHLERGLAVTDLDVLDETVEVRCTGPTGRVETRRARYVVGCDGAASTVRDRTTGLGIERVENPSTYVIADLALRCDLDPATMHLFAADQGFLVLSPLPNGMWRLTASVDDGTELPSREHLQLLVSDRGPRTSSVELDTPVALGRYRVPQAIAPHLRAGRVLLAGDAAHTFSPAGAQGMNVGIGDAVNLGWKLATALDRPAVADALLDSYEVERRPVAEAAAERNERIRGALTLHHPVARGVRDAVAFLARHLDVLRSPLLEGMSGFDVVHDEGAIGGAPGAASGWGRLGGRALGVDTEALAGGRHQLLVTERDARSPIAAVADSCPGVDLVVTDGGRRSGGALVRPDSQIGWLGAARSADDLRDHLARWLGVSSAPP